MLEKSETKISNLLQSMDNLPQDDFEGFKQYFFDLIRELEKQIEELKRKVF